MSRFHLPLDQPNLAEKLLAGASRLKVELIRFRDAEGDLNVFCDYEIAGQLRREEEPAPDLSLVIDLLREFASPKGGAL